MEKMTPILYSTINYNKMEENDYKNISLLYFLIYLRVIFNLFNYKHYMRYPFVASFLTKISCAKFA